MLNWKVTETNILKYEVEVSQGTTQQFVKIGEVASQGTSALLHEYSFIDEEPNKLGTRYYRLKIIEEDGTFSYSPIRSIIFADPVTWAVYPNPSNGIFYLTYQLNSAEKFEAQVFDAKGRLVQQYKKEGNGGWQKFTIDLSSALYPSGVYLLRITTGDKLQSFKLSKQ